MPIMMRLLLLTLLFSLMAGNFPRPAIADQALIVQVCRKTPEPAACQQCLHRNVTADVRGLAFASIGCAFPLFPNVGKDLNEISDGSQDSHVKGVCVDCGYKMVRMYDKLITAEICWAGKDDDSAMDAVGLALGNLMECSNEMKGFETPPKLWDDFNALKKACQVASAVMDQAAPH